ncbi:hypothetical protein Ciccas_000510 [Cichlidogyrus casuarinus]|uniref:Uncharacterized protein n=1 Tax=Cichlidogyrus casuarinus TaxID=1844966 RepID=A0ABD2QN12_9PLAT
MALCGSVIICINKFFSAEEELEPLRIFDLTFVEFGRGCQTSLEKDPWTGLLFLSPSLNGFNLPFLELDRLSEKPHLLSLPVMGAERSWALSAPNRLVMCLRAANPGAFFVHDDTRDPVPISLAIEMRPSLVNQKQPDDLCHIWQTGALLPLAHSDHSLSMGFSSFIQLSPLDQGYQVSINVPSCMSGSVCRSISISLDDSLAPYLVIPGRFSPIASCHLSTVPDSDQKCSYPDWLQPLMTSQTRAILRTDGSSQSCCGLSFLKLVADENDTSFSLQIVEDGALVVVPDQLLSKIVQKLRSCGESFSIDCASDMPFRIVVSWLEDFYELDQLNFKDIVSSHSFTFNRVILMCVFVACATTST